MAKLTRKWLNESESHLKEKKKRERPYQLRILFHERRSSTTVPDNSKTKGKSLEENSEMSKGVSKVEKNNQLPLPSHFITKGDDQSNPINEGQQRNCKREINSHH
ncbi:hypothetical protein PIB30_016318 [Stylosanthes scabra]|uniref:Uncharacterized protein n=1 Tax=Stylosanthes scabra TaxID=79078 RepID=A0ABU6R7M8_9FABA|nr:hypothetical protein [Stylosanthes scabra]